ncbi:threonine/serine dehydratase [Actinoallomurus spadix]|uniref:Threonine/serine dehydratase n=1 Tax=Actinoallomurus spadix TaxID=79912 RepID=A0ABN0WAS7_9ACTN|nr:threonine/serine dehydratase [Actinoallomurus spadix]MCO5988570.1 threonine/serine dehydratase [Actinoallomurus spadix]
MELVSIDDIRTAATSITDLVVHTPLLPCPWAAGHGSLSLKPENLQTTGSFKIRGAYNAIRRCPPSLRDRGVITYSSGNHAQALAYAARALGVPCTVVMPEDARQVKVTATRSLGAEIVLVPPAERKDVATRLAETEGLALIPPFDHPDVIGGQGTVGLEIVEDLPEVDVVLVPVGGGALASGVATAVKSLRPSASVIGVEPELAADAAESLRSGRLCTWPMTRTGRTVADGLRTNLSDLTFAHLRTHLDDLVTVSEEEITDAVAHLARSAHLIVEPSGAVTVAAYLFNKDRLPAGRTVAVLSGGNVDFGFFTNVLVAPSESQGAD